MNEQRTVGRGRSPGRGGRSGGRGRGRGRGRPPLGERGRSRQRQRRNSAEVEAATSTNIPNLALSKEASSSSSSARSNRSRSVDASSSSSSSSIGTGYISPVLIDLASSFQLPLPAMKQVWLEKFKIPFSPSTTKSHRVRAHSVPTSPSSQQANENGTSSKLLDDEEEEKQDQVEKRSSKSHEEEEKEDNMDDKKLSSESQDKEEEKEDNVDDKKHSSEFKDQKTREEKGDNVDDKMYSSKSQNEEKEEEDEHEEDVSFLTDSTNSRKGKSRKMNRLETISGDDSQERGHPQQRGRRQQRRGSGLPTTPRQRQQRGRSQHRRNSGHPSAPHQHGEKNGSSPPRTPSEPPTRGMFRTPTPPPPRGRNVSIHSEPPRYNIHFSRGRKKRRLNPLQETSTCTRRSMSVDAVSPPAPPAPPPPASTTTKATELAHFWPAFFLVKLVSWLSTTISSEMKPINMPNIQATEPSAEQQRQFDFFFESWLSGMDKIISEGRIEHCGHHVLLLRLGHLFFFFSAPLLQSEEAKKKIIQYLERDDVQFYMRLLLTEHSNKFKATKVFWRLSDDYFEEILGWVNNPGFEEFEDQSGVVFIGCSLLTLHYDFPYLVEPEYARHPFFPRSCCFLISNKARVEFAKLCRTYKLWHKDEKLQQLWKLFGDDDYDQQDRTKPPPIPRLKQEWLPSSAMAFPSKEIETAHTSITTLFQNRANSLPKKLGQRILTKDGNREELSSAKHDREHEDEDDGPQKQESSSEEQDPKDASEEQDPKDASEEQEATDEKEIDCLYLHLESLYKKTRGDSDTPKQDLSIAEEIVLRDECRKARHSFEKEFIPMIDIFGIIVSRSEFYYRSGRMATLAAAEAAVQAEAYDQTYILRTENQKLLDTLNTVDQRLTRLEADYDKLKCTLQPPAETRTGDSASTEPSNQKRGTTRTKMVSGGKAGSLHTIEREIDETNDRNEMENDEQYLSDFQEKDTQYDEQQHQNEVKKLKDEIKKLQCDVKTHQIKHDIERRLVCHSHDQLFTALETNVKLQKERDRVQKDLDEALNYVSEQQNELNDVHMQLHEALDQIKKWKALVDPEDDLNNIRKQPDDDASNVAGRQKIVAGNPLYLSPTSTERSFWTSVGSKLFGEHLVTDSSSPSGGKSMDSLEYSKSTPSLTSDTSNIVSSSKNEVDSIRPKTRDFNRRVELHIVEERIDDINEEKEEGEECDSTSSDANDSEDILAVRSTTVESRREDIDELIEFPSPDQDEESTQDNKTFSSRESRRSTSSPQVVLPSDKIDTEKPKHANAREDETNQVPLRQNVQHTSEGYDQDSTRDIPSVILLSASRGTSSPLSNFSNVHSSRRDEIGVNSVRSPNLQGDRVVREVPLPDIDEGSNQSRTRTSHDDGRESDYGGDVVEDCEENQDGDNATHSGGHAPERTPAAAPSQDLLDQVGVPTLEDIPELTLYMRLTPDQQTEFKKFPRLTEDDRQNLRVFLHFAGLTYTDIIQIDVGQNGKEKHWLMLYQLAGGISFDTYKKLSETLKDETGRVSRHLNKPSSIVRKLTSDYPKDARKAIYKELAQPTLRQNEEEFLVRSGVPFPFFCNYDSLPALTNPLKRAWKSNPVLGSYDYCIAGNKIVSSTGREITGWEEFRDDWLKKKAPGEVKERQYDLLLNIYDFSDPIHDFLEFKLPEKGYQYDRQAGR